MDKRLNRRRSNNPSHQPWETTGYERGMGKEGDHPLVVKYRLDLAREMVEDKPVLVLDVPDEKSL